ncbi:MULTISPECIES: LysR substrate-binding domain-containing protein [unclassified Cobetia]|uniref:LysR substrate-binding domain-containing protein n=1 Tax=unclassified Cobetia TaxID=2609414 RepID=UPI002097BA73|nr:MULTISPECIES: LysR substrate-binding domain-containing protein [unclassified Cobetia]MCO7230930.1 LysR substrate-binding domain-containing protein [Cobetia sp. Dlab-2-AX]MCO7234663.1 LysR substrate-binding domain-containing protein [Cobetia sp. Dlab-2-U]
MAKIGHHVSPNLLRVFEVAARHRAFTHAAQELRSTQSAVSQQIRALEEALGMTLFKRVHRGVRLTEAGERLFSSVQEGFAVIEKSLNDIQQLTPSPTLNILTDFAFASAWLMPNLPEFRRLHPSIDVHCMTNQGVLDHSMQEIDVALLFCKGDDSRPRLLRERVFPVCSPEFLERHGPIENLQRLSHLPLLTLTAEQGQAWMDWPTYLAAQGIHGDGGQRELTLNNYPLLLQAAAAGQGVALGWQGLCEEALASGTLIALEEFGLSTDCGYVLIDVNPDEHSAAKQALMDWIKASFTTPVAEVS